MATREEGLAFGRGERSKVLAAHEDTKGSQQGSRVFERVFLEDQDICAGSRDELSSFSIEAER